MKRREFVALIGGLAITWPILSYGQDAKSAPPKRVGILARFRCQAPRQNAGHGKSGRGSGTQERERAKHN
jgi:hypothetical protein